MQETVTSPNERKSLFSSLLGVLEARDRQAQAERQLQEEKYMRRTQRIYDFHDRQRREAVELRQCLEYVSSHAQFLDGVLRGATGAADEVPLPAALVRQAATLQRCMAQCVANAARIRALLAHTHQPQMDMVLAKMEAELSSWSAFVQRAADATQNTEVLIDNLQNLIESQRRCVREVSASTVFTSLCGASTPAGVPPSSSTPLRRSSAGDDCVTAPSAPRPRPAAPAEPERGPARGATLQL